MSNANVINMQSEVNPLESVKKWADAMSERGIYGSDSARLRKTSLEQICSVLSEDEPNEIEWILKNIDDLATRWATIKQGNPGTVRTYRSRARSTLEDYLEYQKDPAHFKPKGTVKIKKGGDEKKKRPAVSKSSKKSAERYSAGVSQADDSRKPQNDGFQSIPSGANVYPLDETRNYVFVLPSQGIKVQDVYKIALHLLTLARDFNPMDPDYAKMFSLVRRESIE
jgi:hypothetical protein